MALRGLWGTEQPSGESCGPISTMGSFHPEFHVQIQPILKAQLKYILSQEDFSTSLLKVNVPSHPMYSSSILLCLPESTHSLLIEVLVFLSPDQIHFSGVPHLCITQHIVGLQQC